MNRYEWLPALSLTVLALGLAGCATKAQDPVQQAVMTPFSDLNLVRAEIPPALLAARAQPYALDAAATCPQWQAEIATLMRCSAPIWTSRPTRTSPACWSVAMTP